MKRTLRYVLETYSIRKMSEGKHQAELPPAYPEEEVYPPRLPVHAQQDAERVDDSKERHEPVQPAPAYDSAMGAQAGEVEDNKPPGYFESTGWGDELDHATNFKASEHMRAIMFENQRWDVIRGEWSTPFPVDRPAWSNGDGRRGCGDRPKFTQNKMWCIDRSEFPEKCDEDGWSYGYNFTEFGSKASLGSGTAKTFMAVRRRRWMAPVPMTILQNVRNSGQYPIEAKRSDIMVDNDDIVFDIIDTEEMAPPVSQSRIFTTHLNPSSAERKGFLIFELDKMWCDLQNKKLRVYSDRKDADPIKVIDLNDVHTVKRGTGNSSSTFMLLTNQNQRFTLSGLSHEDAEAWYRDIKNIVDATKNWETAGQVAVGVGAAVVMALVAGLAGSTGRRHR